MSERRTHYMAGTNTISAFQQWQHCWRGILQLNGRILQGGSSPDWQYSNNISWKDGLFGRMTYKCSKQCWYVSKTSFKRYNTSDFSKCERGTHHLAGTNQRIVQNEYCSHCKAPNVLFHPWTAASSIFQPWNLSPKCSGADAATPRVWYVTLFHAIFLCQHCFLLCCAIWWFYIKYSATLLHCSHCGKNCYGRRTLWRSTWAHSAAGFVQLEHQGVHCAVCEVHCARIDFLWRPSWQIPPPGSRVPRGPLRKLSRNFKGSRLSRPAAAPDGWSWSRR